MVGLLFAFDGATLKQKLPWAPMKAEMQTQMQTQSLPRAQEETDRESAASARHRVAHHLYWRMRFDGSEHFAQTSSFRHHAPVDEAHHLV